MVNSGVANVDGAPAAYCAQGHGLAIVLANGTVALGLHWGAVVPKLSTQRTVASLDDSGSGETAAGGSVQTLKVLADQGAGVAKAVGANKFDLVGHSLNAALATVPAAEVSQLVRALVLVAGFMLGGEPRLELQFELGLA
jgi:3-oxoadipate enol-lactonase